MSDAFAMHLQRPVGIGHTPQRGHTGAAGGAACGDIIRISLVIDRSDPGGKIYDAGFDVSGCGASIAAGSAAVALVRGAGLLEAARIGADEIASELGGLIPAKQHAAELAADALHRALGAAAREAQLAPMAGRVLIAMSGGVDSAVAALISMRESKDAVAVTLELWADPENDAQRSCCSAESVRFARGLAHRLGLPHFSLDMRAEFRAGVVEPWLADHAAGLTPYPCVRCNGNVRLDGMLDLAGCLGAQQLVTGHYARTCVESEGDLPLLRRALDQRKDQSYALAALSRGSLGRMRFPLGELSKDEVRQIAEREQLSVARRPDSQDLCFLAGTNQRDFLARHSEMGERDGEILDQDGTVLGVHRGAQAFTIGQRHGLGVGGRGPLYVLATDPRSNTVIVGGRKALATEQVSIRQAVLHRDGARVDAIKIRYMGRPIACSLAGTPGPGAHAALEAQLSQQIERTAAGQLACLYSGETVVGHGTIAA
ncbi:MAG TPA: tRNA 2-thiouridine(34) synthase MnmA [Solirubrobacteraceae bacterium]|nr:tRNA 2-thiouridine(34) synthase MnmA [Solirubrobacteraceae bacterium]